MTVDIRVGFRQMVDEAVKEIETIPVEEAIALHGREDVIMVDLRDVRELALEGRIPGSFHMPRCMLEFWIDPESPYYKDVFAEGKRFVFYCNKGWRSALATQTAQRMGLKRVGHVDGGFGAWRDAGGPVEEYRKR
ncbi:MAG: rhodanese-like domain-containing protein [Gammaproteobacteria bacterium]|nr:rhodanese-like domain-containing protein [Gammaproteobacteria bacterium]